MIIQPQLQAQFRTEVERFFVPHKPKGAISWHHDAFHIVYEVDWCCCPEVLSWSGRSALVQSVSWVANGLSKLFFGMASESDLAALIRLGYDM